MGLFRTVLPGVEEHCQAFTSPSCLPPAMHRQRAGLGASGPSDDWDSQMAYAMHAELQGSMHAKPVASDQDVDEGGWLPK